MRNGAERGGDRGSRGLHGVIESLERQNKAVISGAGILTVAALALLDYASGPEVAFAIFYLIPISIVARLKGFRGSAPVALAAAIAWAVADIQAGASYSNGLIPVWNMTTRLGIFTIVASLVSSQRKQVALEKALARHDSLTGIGNARAFEERAELELERLKRYGEPLTVAYLDIDNFKSINDERGHSGGDEALRNVARQLVAGTRSTDFVARLGGDEFSILLPRTGEQAARTTLSGLRARMEENVQDGHHAIGFTLGAVTYETPPGSIDEMIAAADDLMYKGKRGGKGTIIHSTWHQPTHSAPLDETVAPRG